MSMSEDPMNASDTHRVLYLHMWTLRHGILDGTDYPIVLAPNVSLQSDLQHADLQLELAHEGLKVPF